MKIEILSDNDREIIEIEIEEAEDESREIEERKNTIKNELNSSFKNRIKEIFKKYGFTVAAIFSCVGVVVSIIISLLTPGLTKMNGIIVNGLKKLKMG